LIIYQIFPPVFNWRCSSSLFSQLRAPNYTKIGDDTDQSSALAADTFLCFKTKHVKGNCGRKSRPNFALLHLLPLKLGERWAKCRWILHVKHETKSLIYFGRPTKLTDEIKSAGRGSPADSIGLKYDWMSVWYLACFDCDRL